MPLADVDRTHLEQAMHLAEQALGCTSPNPIVGAVIVRGAEVIGEGYHAGPWRDHAEVAAIKDAIRRAKSGAEIGSDGGAEAPAARELCTGATMYVTLEPCCTYGRTPPCTSALIEACFGRVVVGAVDPTPAVNGRGLELLRAAGIQVELADGELAVRVKRQNCGLRKTIATGLPFITYKYAMTLDGRVAADSGDSRWISGPESRALVHRWRSWADAVLVGAGTLAADDPRLTARHTACERQPLRVVVSGELRLKRGSSLVRTADEGPVLAICSADVANERRAEVESWGVETVEAGRGKDGDLDPREVAEALGLRGVQTVLLEGGPRLAGAWWAAGLIDKVAAFICPRIASGRGSRNPLCGLGVSRMDDAVSLREVEIHRVGPDLLVVGYTGEAF